MNTLDILSEFVIYLLT